MALLVVFSSCVRNQKGQVLENTAPTNEKVFEVVEVVQASSYSYLRVKENFSEKWVAVTKQEFAVGDVYYYDTALEMPDFKSKDLDRTFDLVYFVNAISKTPMNQMPQNHVGAGAPAHSGKVESGKKSSVTMKKMDNEITVAQVFANRKDYSSKEFEI